VQHSQCVGTGWTRAVIPAIGVAATQNQHFHSSCVARTFRKCVAHEVQGAQLRIACSARHVISSTGALHRPEKTRGKYRRRSSSMRFKF
jgi:hypothetical protein